MLLPPGNTGVGGPVLAEERGSGLTQGSSRLTALSGRDAAIYCLPLTPHSTFYQRTDRADRPF